MNLSNSGPYATPEDNQTARSLGVSVNVLRLQRLGDELSLAYLEYCEARRDAASTPAARDFWHRLAGSVRKAATL